MLALLIVGGLLLLAGPAAAAPNYEDVIDITFPTLEESASTGITGGAGHNWGFINDYMSGRGNTCGIHRATDIFGPHGQEVFAAEGGTVTWLSTGSHYIIEVTSDAGYRYRYMHLGRGHQGTDQAFAPGIEKGATVERGEHIGYIGSSGNASADNPHLHFEIAHPDLHDTPCRSGGWGYYNPFPSLKDAVERGDVPGLDVEPEVEVDLDLVDRLAGPSRVETAVELAKAAHPDGVDHVVVAPGWSYPEAIAAGPLAAALDAPVLLTRSEELHRAVADAIDKLGAHHVTLVGDDGALAAQVAEDLAADTAVEADEVERLAGDGPVGTAATVAGRVRELTGADRVLIARGADPDDPDGWPDALASGWYGAASGEPVVMVEPGSLPEATAAALEGVSEAVIAGGTRAVETTVEDAIAHHVDRVTRLAGENRYLTATELVDDLLDRGVVEGNHVWVATAGDFADAQSAAPTVVARGGVLALVDGAADASRDGLDDWFAGHADRFSAGTAIGGTRAISEEALHRLAERLGG